MKLNIDYDDPKMVLYVFFGVIVLYFLVLLLL